MSECIVASRLRVGSVRAVAAREQEHGGRGGAEVLELVCQLLTGGLELGAGGALAGG